MNSLLQSLPQLKIPGDCDLETLLSEVLGEMDRRESSPGPPLSSDDTTSPQHPATPLTIANGNENVSCEEMMISEGEFEDPGWFYFTRFLNIFLLLLL